MFSPSRPARPTRRWPSLALLTLAAFAPALAGGQAASAAPAADANHLIISEVVTTVFTTDDSRPRCSDYIEIVNPTAGAIDLSEVYLTDGTALTSGVGYWRLAEAAPTSTTAGGGTGGDFHARFPDGYVLAAGDTIVVSVLGSNSYSAAYGRLPDFEVFEDADTPDAVPELVEVFPGSINAGPAVGGTNAPNLIDASESVVLYTWDGSTDLVADLDYMRWGTSTSVIVNKTGVTVGSSTYLADTAPASQQTVSGSALVFGQGYARLSADEGTETLTGGNGLTGHDETSENLASTWHVTTQSPPQAPATWFPAAPILTAGQVSPAQPVAGVAAEISVAVASASALTGVDFHYSIDGAPAVTVAGADAGGGRWAATVPAQAADAVVTWYAVAANAAGGAGAYPASAPRFTGGWTAIAVPPPSITAAQNAPGTPGVGQDVTLSVTATSISPLTGATFHYRVDGGSFTTLAGAAQGGGVYTATVPAQSLGAVVDWYVEVSNEAGLTAAHPSDAPATTVSWTVVEASEVTKLLITEVCTLGTSQEFVEIYNPSAGDVDLSDYYLTDAVHNEQGYWLIGGGVLDAATIGGGAFYDFNARFPAGFTIAAGDTIVVSIAGSGAFNTSFGFDPDLELFEDAGIADAVPDMRWIFGDATTNSIYDRTNSAGGTPSLTNSGEVVALYHWRAGDDLVTDIDMFAWTSASSTTTSYHVYRNGVTVGSSMYAPDTAVASQQPFGSELTFGDSYVRVDAGEGTQTATGGNGVDGRDETSENWTATFSMAASDPSRPSGTGGPYLVVTAAGNTPRVPFGDMAVTLSVTAASDTPITGAVFHVKYDAGAFSDITGATTDNLTFTAALPGQPVGTVVAWYVSLANQDGLTAVYPAGAPAETSGWTVIEEPDPNDFPAKLLITEVATLGTDQEFVEIVNPGTTAVDMSDYYLTDAIYSGGDQYYWRIAEAGTPSQTTVGGGAFYDFNARFPAGYMLAAGDTVVVSLAGSRAFAGAFGFMPDIELWEDDASADSVPDMRWIFGNETTNSIYDRTNSAGGTPSLTNAGEMVMLYNWHAGSDIVVDIDWFAWLGPNATTTSFLFARTDWVSGSHTYFDDTPVASQQPFPTEASFGSSYQRVDPLEGTQATAGGNGVLGRDELSENLPTTFQLLPYSPAGRAVGASVTALDVPARTFLPGMGERFPIRFSADLSGAHPAEVRLRLFDLDGRLVMTLYDSRFDPSPVPDDDGLRTITWDGLDANFQRVSGGLYVLHFSVVDYTTGEEHNQTAPVVVATRLSN